MPLIFQVLRCYKCEVFQVHPTKKSERWKCKLCDEKQSIKRFYGLGTAKECRLHVQKLNGIRGELDDNHRGSDTSDLSTGTISESPECSGQEEIPPSLVAKKSKWLDYVDTETAENPKTEEVQVSPNIIMHLNNTKVILELPKKRPRKDLIVNKGIVNKAEINDFQEIHSQRASLSDSKENTNFIKCVKNKANAKSCKTNPTINALAPTIAKNSKWAKFVDGPQNSHDANVMDPIIYTNKKSNSIFPFIEDEDIDSVLDF